MAPLIVLTAVLAVLVRLAVLVALRLRVDRRLVAQAQTRALRRVTDAQVQWLTQETVRRLLETAKRPS